MSHARIPAAAVTGPTGYVIKHFAEKMMGEVPDGIGGELDTVVSVTVEDGHITNVYAIRNPHKLAALREVAQLARA